MARPSKFTIDRDRLVDQLADLVRIDSTNPELVSDGAGEAEIAKALRDAGAAVLGQAPPDGGQTFWTDAALLSAAGTETVVLGPVSDGLHTTEEWGDLDSVEDLTRILVRTTLRYCA